MTKPVFTLFLVIFVFSQCNALFGSPLPEKPRRQTSMEKLIPKIEENNLHKVVSYLSSLKNRYSRSETGVRASSWLRQAIFTMLNELPAERRKLFKTDNTGYINHPNIPQPSVVCVMEGKSLNKEVVIIGANIDSMNKADKEGPAPGADDNASGISTMFEALRIIAQSDFIPERSIHFIAYAAGQMNFGMTGSDDVVKKYKARQVPVHAVLQIQNVGYVFQNQTRIGISYDSFSTDVLTVFTSKVVLEYTKRGYATIGCSSPCYDHSSWTSSNFRGMFISSRNSIEGRNPHSGRDTDTIEKLDFARMKDFVTVAMGFAVELST